MKKVIVAILIVVICLSLSGCCMFCPPGDATQMQVADPCWECWQKDIEKEKEKKMKKIIREWKKADR